MSLAQQFYTTVPESGTITLPPEFRGTEVVILETTPKKPPAIAPDEFWRRKTLDEIDAEQGGPKICTNPDEYFGFLSEFLGSKEEVEEFLRRRKEEA